MWAKDAWNAWDPLADDDDILYCKLNLYYITGHPGSTDRYGCHVDMCGDYHCHP